MTDLIYVTLAFINKDSKNELKLKYFTVAQIKYVIVTVQCPSFWRTVLTAE